MIRKTIFWTHLVCGLTAGLVVAMMSFTGVLLTYERQILAFADRALYSEAAPGVAARPIEDLIAAVQAENPGLAAASVTILRHSQAPVGIGAGRAGTVYVDRYTAEVLGPGATGLRAFFRGVEGWHRWFNLSGDSRNAARAVTDGANLLFLFLVLSGLYLWLPPAYRWAAFKTRLLFNPKAHSGKARDYNWHHVFGIWSAIPLAVVVATSVVFSYGWANDLVYRSFGEAPPRLGGPGPGGRAGGGGPGGPGADAGARPATSAGTSALGEPLADSQASAPARLDLDALLARGAAQAGNWRTITLLLPRGEENGVTLQIDRGNGGQPQHRERLVLDAYSGEVVSAEPFSSQTPGRRARTIIRFLHTGEVLGIAGQTIAGVVSLASLFMVWTGWALAYRRLIRPLFARSRRAPS